MCKKFATFFVEFYKIINEKIDAITKELLEQQRETIELADKIEEIKGLLVDVYK